MTSRRAIVSAFLRAALGAVPEAHEVPLNLRQIVCSVPAIPGEPRAFTLSDARLADTPASATSPASASCSAPGPRRLPTPASDASTSAFTAHAAIFSTFGSSLVRAAAMSTAPAAAEAASTTPTPTTTTPTTTSSVPVDGTTSSGLAAGAASSSPAADPSTLLAHRAQLAESLAMCLGMQQLDALLARPENREVVDEMLLLSALDVAYRLCASVSASVPPAPTAQLAAAVKSSAEAASDALTRLSELLIQRLSEPGALSAEGAVRALRTLAMLRFNPAGDYAGLQTMAAFYREAVLPQLQPELLPPDLAARAPQLLADLFFAFSRLFEVAARREKELQTQLLAAQVAEEEGAAAAREDAGTSGSGGDAALPPWQRGAAASSSSSASSASPHGLHGGIPLEELVVLGDRQLYGQLCKMLAAPGLLSNVPSKTLGTLATALATARYTHFALAQSIATQTLLRLQGVGLAGTDPGAAAAAGVRLEAHPIANDAMPTSTLSNILSCLARLGYEHEALCDAVANWMLQRLQGPAGPPAGAAAGAPGPGFSGVSGRVGGIEPHHVVDVAVAFVRIKYENMDFLLSASEVLQLKLPQANPQSVSMMTWAIANSKYGRYPEFEGALNALAQRMVALHRYSLSAGGGGGGRGGGGLAVVPRHLSCMVFALARLGHKHLRLMDATAADVVARADKYQARQLCTVLRAFTMLGEYVPGMYDAACAVLTSRLRSLAGQSAASLAVAPPAAEFVFTAQHYADVAWAVAMAGHAPRVPELMELLGERLVEVAPQLGKACVVRAAQAYAVAGSSEPRLMEALAQAARPLLVDLGPEYLSVLVGSFAESQHPVSQEFWMACMDAVGLKIPHMERPRPDMQLATARLCDAFRRHPATQQFPACREHYVLPMLEALMDSQQQQLQQQQQQQQYS